MKRRNIAAFSLVFVSLWVEERQELKLGLESLQ